MYQPGGTQSTKGKCHSQKRAFLISYIESYHSHNADDKTFDPDFGKKISCQDRLIHRSWFFLHHLFGMRLQSQRDCRKAVCQKVDKQQMHRRKRYRKVCQRRIEHSKDPCKVSGKQKLDGALNIFIDIPAVLYCLYDGGKIIICQHHGCRVLGNLCSRNAHCHADVCLL